MSCRLLAVMSSLLLLAHSSPPATATPSPAPEGWRETAFSRLAAREYQASDGGSGLQAPNREQEMRTFFHEDRIEIVPRRDEVPSWRFGWKTVRWGRREEWSRATYEAPIANRSRVTYEGDGLSEWYENRPDGLEQGFIVQRRPHGTGMLRIEAEVAPSLRPQLQDGAIEFHDASGVHVLHVDGLQVWDAAGRKLGAEFEVTNQRVAIVVQDEDAIYPITVDPVMTTPSWIGTGEASGDFYGYTVATAGDVNGDGFSDVLVGAHDYDGTLNSQGAAFLYFGSAAGLSSVPAWTGLGEAIATGFGWDVQTAGDVNGDGFDDVIVGAPLYTSTEFQAGRAYVYHGSASGPSTMPDWTADGEAYLARFGSAAGGAGDVNGDGFDDVIVGSPQFGDDQATEGRAYVFYGSASGLSPSVAWTEDGDQFSARLGSRVGTAGDVNADGFADVFVAAYSYDGSSSDMGQVRVFHGSATGLAAVPDWVTEGEKGSAWYGSDAGMAGDLNGDGYGDFIVGASHYTSGGLTGRGAVYVYWGSSTGLNVTPFSTTYGPEANSQRGSAVSTAGDVNGDGYADVVIGSALYQTGVGRAEIWLGGPSGIALDGSTNRNDPSSQYGWSVATAGDVDGDGFSDVIIGAPHSDQAGSDFGAAFLYRGSAVGLDPTETWATAGTNSPSSYFGASVCGAGDVNGDGFSDVIIGAHGFDGGQPSEGAAFLYLGSANGLGVAVWSAEGNSDYAAFGRSVASAGDVNGDGYADVIIGANEFTADLLREGAAFVYLGSAAGLSTTPDWTVSDADQSASDFGWAVCGAGDFNGNGFADVAVGAPNYRVLASRIGAVYVYLGGEAGLGTAPAWSTVGVEDQDGLGWSVSEAGDANGDGYSDLVVGSPYLGATDIGRVMLYSGSSHGLETLPSWTAQGEVGGTDYAASVSFAGDVNGDGYSDVLVGAPNLDTDITDVGRAYLYLGSSLGPSALPDWTSDGEFYYSYFGTAVASAGDVDGDGYSDLIIGSLYDHYTGRAYLYLGSADGSPQGPTWIAYGEGSDRLGGAVASAGDVDADGFSDVVIGAWGYSIAAGRALVYHGNAGRGSLRAVQQRRSDDSGPIALGGLSDSASSFRLSAFGRSPAGRAPLRLEIEAKPLAQPFDGVGTQLTSSVDSGLQGVALDASIAGLQPDTAYRWRMRIVSDSPFFPHSQWFSPPGNAATELDLRTGPTSTAVELPQIGPSVLSFAAPYPNPSSGATQLAFTMREGGRIRLEVYDARGRRVSTIADRDLGPGSHVVIWNALGKSGSRVANGVYFVRLIQERTVVTREVTLMR